VDEHDRRAFAGFFVIKFDAVAGRYMRHCYPPLKINFGFPRWTGGVSQQLNFICGYISLRDAGKHSAYRLAFGE
jgi:hypothetical protein